MKKKVLEFLQSADGFVSGQEICDALGVSRTAVWKYMNALKEEGFEIESVSRKGYRLVNGLDMLTEYQLKKVLEAEEYSYPVFLYPTIDSTNEEAKRQAIKGAADRSTYVSDQQTAGKGRRGRNWISPKGEDIFFSILLRPEIPTECASMLTLVAAMAAVVTCEKFSGEDCQIKWPNDIVLHGRKICGILTEMSAEMNEISYVVIGIGFNINRTIFAEEISDMASSIYKETGIRVNRSEFFAFFMKQFWKYYEQFLDTRNLRPFLDKYNAHLINVDRQVKLIQNREEKIRKALGINALGELMVEDEYGNIEHVFSGEVSVRGIYGYV